MAALTFLALSTLGELARLAAAQPSQNIDSLVIFGDSYADVNYVFNGGTAWPDYARMYGDFSAVYSYAQAGQRCSSEFTAQPDTSASFLVQNSTPAFLADKLPINQAKTLYTIWIGTDYVDLGKYLANETTLDTIFDANQCLIDWIDYMYNFAGARNFLFMNTIPLHRKTHHGPKGYPWAFHDKPVDAGLWTRFMQKTVPTINALADARLRVLALKLRRAHIGILDIYSLFEDMYHNPSQYVNGTLPLDSNGAASALRFEPNGRPVGETCPTTDERDSYLWRDEFQPGELWSRVVAMEVKNSVKGGSPWVEWLSQDCLAQFDKLHARSLLGTSGSLSDSQ